MKIPRPAIGTVLCRLDEIEDPGGRGFEWGDGGGEERVFVVRRGAQVWGYLNRCPHAFTPLDWVADQFLTLDKQRLQCATHMAEFRIEDGYCVAGPCRGKSLRPFPIELREGAVVIAPDAVTIL